MSPTMGPIMETLTTRPARRSRRPRKRLALLGAGLLAVAVVLAAACGGGDVSESEFDELRTEVAELRGLLESANTTADRALLVASMPALEVARFHDIDELINNEGTIHATHPGIVSRAIGTLESPIWPAELSAHVAQFLAALQDLQGLVLADDAAEAGRPATIAHANSHAFEESVNAYLTGEEIQPPPEISTSKEAPARP